MERPSSNGHHDAFGKTEARSLRSAAVRCQDGLWGGYFSRRVKAGLSGEVTFKLKSQ